ncbi:asparagine synthase-related protein [Natrinema pallidum]|uniref:asparagine synthase-related protein n=1 Tax=Natrinema pallidum TaxID=69527 RepID=UPI001268D603|nr:asparagine synthase-related protein [Natrinema pallidum]
MTQLLISNPGAVHLETGERDIVLSGSRPKVAINQITRDGGFDSIVDDLSSLPGEYSLITVERQSDTVVRAYRGISSSFDIYYSCTPDDTVVVGDHFRDVLSTIPIDERTVSDSVAGDQILFGTRPSGSYVNEINRLGHGERLNWLVGEQPEVTQIQQLSQPESLTRSIAQQRLDTSLKTVIQDDNRRKSTATMLSGGVDSTLLHTYANTTNSVSGAINSPKYNSEIEYAHQASDLLNSNHDLLEFDESEFVKLVETATEATGHPLLHLQTTHVFTPIEFLAEPLRRLKTAPSI